MLSFLADAILVVIISQFVIFPLLGAALDTDLPAVAVISDSMDHNGKTFNTWWDNHESKYNIFNITKTDFQTYNFLDGFNKGDVLIVKGKDRYKPGEVIIYNTPARATPIIHRVVTTDGTYQTYGDANSGQLTFEKTIDAEQISGEAIYRIPFLGWPKVWLVELIGQ